MKEITCKLLVIGAGPGGYVAAIRAGQRYKGREVDGRMERDRSMEPPGKSRGR